MVVEPGRVTAKPARRRAAWRPRVPSAVAWLVRLIALTTVIGVLHPGQPNQYASLREDAVADGVAFAAAASSAAVMLLLAGALRRRKRRAWALIVGVAAVAAVAHAEARQWGDVALHVALLAVLVWARRDFTAESEPRGRLAAVRVLVVMGGISVLAGLFLTRDTAAPGTGFGRRLGEVLYGLVGFSPDLRFREPGLSDLTQIALTTLGALTALLTLLALLAPARKPARLDPSDEARLRELLERYGDRDSLGYFALRRDKTAIWSRTGKAAVVHRVVGGVSLASGDPIGDPEAWPGAVEAWLDEAERFGWIPGALGVSEAGATTLCRAGLDALELGDEAVLDLDRFSLDGRSMRGVRQAVNRVGRAGYTATVHRQAALTDREIAEVTAAAIDLRTDKVERGFSMALCRLGDRHDPEMVIVRVRDATGRLVCVLGFVPWGTDGLSLDVMRRSRDSENGTIEFAIAAVAEQARRWGLRRISLNFAVFRAVFERASRVGAGPVLRMWHRLLLFVSRWFQIESLYRANAKYQPDWVPRFVCFRRAADLPRVAIAALEAEAFLVWPKPRRLAR